MSDHFDAVFIKVFVIQVSAVLNYVNYMAHIHMVTMHLVHMRVEKGFTQ